MGTEAASRTEGRRLEQELESFHPASFGWALTCCRWDRDEAEEVLASSRGLGSAMEGLELDQLAEHVTQTGEALKGAQLEHLVQQEGTGPAIRLAGSVEEAAEGLERLAGGRRTSFSPLPPERR